MLIQKYKDGRIDQEYSAIAWTAKASKEHRSLRLFGTISPYVKDKVTNEVGEKIARPLMQGRIRGIYKKHI